MNMLRFILNLVLCYCLNLDIIKGSAIKRTINNDAINEIPDILVPHSSEPPLAYCSQPLGISRDSINIQVAFTVSTNDLPPRMRRSGSHDEQDRSYIQVEFERPMYVSGMITQGSPNTESRVTHFRVTYSADCVRFHTVADRTGTHTEFVGNLYVNTTNTVMFNDVLVAKCVRIIPTRTVGEDTAIRFELLGCDMGSCRSELIPAHAGQPLDFKTFDFDKEKIISSIKIISTTEENAGAPAFILAASRSCDFALGGHLGRNNRTQIYTMDPGASELIINDEQFPIRAQCVVVFSPDPGMIPLFGVDIDHEVQGQLRKLEPSQYHVTFSGCDALEPHEALTTCGQTRLPHHHHHHHREKRVVGGQPSLPGEWPWLVSLHFLGSHTFTDSSGLPHICGASLIHPQWLLSAAHCFHDLLGEGLSDKDNWIAVAGEHYQGNYDGTEQSVRIEKVISHPLFVLAVDQPILHDIALIKLVRPVHLSDYVNTICLDANYTVPNNKQCFTSGWGLVDVDGVGVELPNSAKLSVVPHEVCNQNFASLPDDDEAKQSVYINESVLCARANETGIDSCSGDSGGPLVCYHDNHWTQVGIVSLGYGCGDIRYPGIYTSIQYFYNWISDVIMAESEL